MSTEAIVAVERLALIKLELERFTPVRLAFEKFALLRTAP